LRDYNAADVRADAALALWNAFNNTQGSVWKYLGGEPCFRRYLIMARSIKTAALSLLRKETRCRRNVVYLQSDVVGDKDLRHPNLDVEDAYTIIVKIRRQLVGWNERAIFERILRQKDLQTDTFERFAEALPRFRRVLEEMMMKEPRRKAFDEVVAAIRVYRLYGSWENVQNDV